MLHIYQASVLNVRELKKQKNNIKRLFNKSIRVNDNSSFEALTKIYALLYSTFAEVCFLKMIHTPYGFSEDEIKQINREAIDGRIRERNLEQKWKKCLELAFLRVTNIANAGEIQNKKQILSRHIEKYIIEPSQLRNKIAHGQWSNALNSENTAVNLEMTNKIRDLDFVKIEILFSSYEKIGQAIEDLIESPYKAHFRDFYFHMTELEIFLKETNNWTLESKIKKLKGAAIIQKEIREKRNTFT